MNKNRICFAVHCKGCFVYEVITCSPSETAAAAVGSHSHCNSLRFPRLREKRRYDLTLWQRTIIARNETAATGRERGERFETNNDRE